MPNPKTGKPQLCDYENKEPKKVKPKVDVFAQRVGDLPDKPTEEASEAEVRHELDGILNFRK